MNNPKFQIKKGSNSQYYFNLIASNGEPILRSSEGYITKQGCQTGIASVKANAPWDARYNKTTSGNQYYFTLHAANGEKIAVSEMYNSAHGRDNGIISSKTNAPVAGIEDLA